MRAIRPPSLSRSSLFWLVWFALLLPLAQGAAVWHGYTHPAQVANADQEDGQAPHSAPCDLCLSAANLSGGGLLGVPPGVSISIAHDELPQVAAGGVLPAAPTLAYLSRAPPAASL